MDPDSSPLQHEHKHQHDSEQHHQSAESSLRDFASVEELLRFDAGQTAVPASLQEKLADSLAQEPSDSRSWWRRFFSASD